MAAARQSPLRCFFHSLVPKPSTCAIRVDGIRAVRWKPTFKYDTATLAKRLRFFFFTEAANCILLEIVLSSYEHATQHTSIRRRRRGNGTLSR